MLLHHGTGSVKAIYSKNSNGQSENKKIERAIEKLTKFGPVKANPKQLPTPDLDVNLVLNPDWRDAFLLFMVVSHLEPDRLQAWAHALATTFPNKRIDPCFHWQPTAKAITYWLESLCTEDELKGRKKRIDEIKAAGGLGCCVFTVPIINTANEVDDQIATLIVAFEFQTETLIHHIVRHSAKAADVLSVAQTLVKDAIANGPFTDPEIPRYLLLPDIAGEEAEDWCSELRSFFEKNLPAKPGVGGASKAVSIPGDFHVSEKSRAMEIKRYGRPKTVRHDLWIPLPYDLRVNQIKIKGAHAILANVIHDQLVIASKKVQKIFKQNTEAGKPKPTWRGISRARRPLRQKHIDF